jgi:hypothetical protein
MGQACSCSEEDSLGSAPTAAACHGALTLAARNQKICWFGQTSIVAGPSPEPVAAPAPSNEIIAGASCYGVTSSSPDRAIGPGTSIDPEADLGWLIVAALSGRPPHENVIIPPSLNDDPLDVRKRPTSYAVPSKDL